MQRWLQTPRWAMASSRALIARFGSSAASVMVPGSSLEARRQPGLFSATVQTKNESAAEVAQLVKAELTRHGQLTRSRARNYKRAKRC